jgi:hypothetical protein
MKKMNKLLLFMTAFSLAALFLFHAGAVDEAPVIVTINAEDTFVDLEQNQVVAKRFAAASGETDIYQDMKTQLVTQLKVAYQNGKTEIQIKNTTGTVITSDTLKQVYLNTLYDYPEELYFARTVFSYAYVSEPKFVAGATITIYPQFFSGLDYAAYQAAVDQALVACFGGTTRETMSQTTDLEKVVLAHDYLVSTCQYDPYVSKEGNYTTTAGTTYSADELVYSAYGAFVKRNVVCQGYSLAMKVLLDRAGVNCCYVSSNSMNHAWNMVQLDGNWYHVDATFDDPIYSTNSSTVKADIAGRVSHERFLLSDSEMTAYGYSGWSTENGYSCSSSYSLASVVRDSDTGVYLKDGILYTLNGKTLASYAAGTDFASPIKSAELGDTPIATAFSYDQTALYYSLFSGAIYQLDLTKDVWAGEKLTDTGTMCGVRVLGNCLYGIYDYDPVFTLELASTISDSAGDAEENENTTDTSMPVVLTYDPEELSLEKLEGQTLALNTEKLLSDIGVTVCFISYDENGRMLAFQTLTVTGGQVTLPGAASGADSVKITVISGSCTPLSSAIEIGAQS